MDFLDSLKSFFTPAIELQAEPTRTVQEVVKKPPVEYPVKDNSDLHALVNALKTSSKEAKYERLRKLLNASTSSNTTRR
jgi:hypothetical protein